MRWGMRFLGLLFASAALVAIKYASLYPSDSPAGAAIVTGLIFFFGVYFIPDRITRQIEKKRAEAPDAPDAPTADVPEEICAPEMKQAIPAQDTPVEHMPKEEKVPKRRRIPSDVVGYQFAVFILLCLAVLFAINSFGASAQIEELNIKLDERYHDGYRDAENDIGRTTFAAYSEGLDIGYGDGYKAGYTDGFEHCERGGLLLPSQRD